MKCAACGTEIAGNPKFCPECGAKIEPKQKRDTLVLRCQCCNGLMTIDDDSPVLYCQYCGSKELIPESDTVKIQRIKSKTRKEIEIEKLKHEERKEIRQEEKEKIQTQEKERNKFQKSFFSKVLLILVIICLLVSWNAFSKKKILSGLIAGVQTVVFALSWLTGMQFIQKKRPNIHILFAVIGTVLIFAFIKTNSSEIIHNTFIWPSSGLYSMLPEPKSREGSISDYGNSICIYIDNPSEEDFQAYIESCIELGYTVEANRKNSSYDAFNKDGYKLRLDLYQSLKLMDIRLSAPKSYDEVRWPESDIARLLPVPQSHTGKIEYDASNRFEIYVNNTPIDEFNTYIDACREKGFTADYRRDDAFYYADNAEGYHLELEYEGCNTISICINKPEEKE